MVFERADLLEPRIPGPGASRDLLHHSNDVDEARIFYPLFIMEWGMTVSADGVANLEVMFRHLDVGREEVEGGVIGFGDGVATAELKVSARF